MKLYFVTARQGWETVFGGHWIASSPKEAIAIARKTIEENTTGIGLSSCDELEFKASKSNASISNAMNA